MKKNVGIVMGGYSSEFEISMKSGEVVYRSLSGNNDFNLYRIRIDRKGWVVLLDREYPVDKNDFTFSFNGEKVAFDVVFNAIHGTPGEDGYLQAYFDLLGVRHTSCDFFESALTFNKAKTNIILSQAGIECPKGKYLNASDPVNPDEIINALGLPLFIKPNRSGSSYGVSRVEDPSKFMEAWEEAAKEDDQIVLESAVSGTEVGCGVARINGIVVPLAITEIVPKKAFFDYEAKYHGASDEITPARISDELAKKIMDRTMYVYKYLGLKGIVRADYIIDASSGEPVFIEANTVPGLSEESIIPQQLKYCGYELSDFFTLVIHEALK